MLKHSHLHLMFWQPSAIIMNYKTFWREEAQYFPEIHFGDKELMEKFRTFGEKVFDKLTSFVQLPADVTKVGILKSDKKMLETWRLSIEHLWFEEF